MHNSYTKVQGLSSKKDLSSSLFLFFLSVDSIAADGSLGAGRMEAGEGEGGVEEGRRLTGGLAGAGGGGGAGGFNSRRWLESMAKVARPEAQWSG